MLIHGFPDKGSGFIQVRVHLLSSYEECEGIIKESERKYFAGFVKTDWTICRKPIRDAEPFLNKVYGRKFDFGKKIV